VIHRLVILHLLTDGIRVLSAAGWSAKPLKAAALRVEETWDFDISSRWFWASSRPAYPRHRRSEKFNSPIERRNLVTSHERLGTGRVLVGAFDGRIENAFDGGPRVLLVAKPESNGLREIQKAHTFSSTAFLMHFHFLSCNAVIA